MNTNQICLKYFKLLEQGNCNRSGHFILVLKGIFKQTYLLILAFLHHKKQVCHVTSVFTYISDYNAYIFMPKLAAD